MDEKWIRRLAAVVVLAVAAVAAVISFGHIFDLAHAHGQDVLASALLPLSVDGEVLASSLALLHAARQRRDTPLLARFMLALGVGATIAANVAFGAPYGPLGAIISSWPGIAFVGSAEMALAMVRSSRRAEDAPMPEDGPMPSVHRIFADQIAAKTVPSIRAIKTAMGCGQDRASQVQAYLTLLAEN